MTRKSPPAAGYGSVSVVDFGGSIAGRRGRKVEEMTQTDAGTQRAGPLGDLTQLGEQEGKALLVGRRRGGLHNTEKRGRRQGPVELGPSLREEQRKEDQHRKWRKLPEPGSGPL